MTACKTLFIKGILGLCLLFPFFSNAQKTPTFERALYTSKGDTMPYRILFPKFFNSTKKYPLIIVLHGAGERGNDNEVQLAYGPKLFLQDTVRDKYASFVVYPQCPKDSYWSNVNIETNAAGKMVFHFKEGGDPTKAMKTLMALIDQLLDKPYIDKHHVYVGGLSMGGMGTYELLRREPNTFAAAFAICGGDNTLNVKKYAKKVPLWIFHGAKDDVVPLDHSLVMVDALKAAGADPKFTLYPNDNHNSWDDAFAEPQLLPWLFSHSK